MPRPAVIHCTPPLQVAAVAEVVLVQHVAVEDVGRGLEAAVRMVGKSGHVVVGVFRRKLVEHEERVEPRRVGLAQAAAQLDTGAVGGGDRLDDALQGA